MNMKCNQKYNLCDENPTDCHFELKTFVQELQPIMTIRTLIILFIVKVGMPEY